MQVLVALGTNAGAVVSRAQLIDSCWGGRVVGDDAINRCIAKLRRLGEEFEAFEIETVSRVGYRLLARKAPHSVVAMPHRRLFLAALAALVFAVLSSGAFWYWRIAGQAVQPKVAVLPFTALSSDREASDLAKIIADTTANVLVQTGTQLADGDLRTLKDARRAGAAFIVSGTIRREGAAFRVTARVDSVRRGTTILANEFDADSSASSTLAGQVAAWLIPSFRMWQSFLPAEPDVGVSNEILRIFLTRSAGDGLRAWKLSQALAAAKPRSGVVQFVYALLTSDVLPDLAPEQRVSVIASARQAALRAAAALPNPARAQALLTCHLNAPGWKVLTPGCDEVMRRTISADPDVPVLPYLFASQLEDTGRFVEAAKFADMELAANPIGPNQLRERIFIERMMRGGGSAEVLSPLEARTHRYVGPGSTDYVDFLAAVAQGDFTAAERLIVQPEFGPADDTIATAKLALRATRSRMPGEVKAMYDSCNPPVPNPTPLDPAFGICLTGFAKLRDFNALFALADRGYRDVECCSAAELEKQWLSTGGGYYSRAELFGKAMVEARADPRFIEIARRTGLLAYWKKGHPPDFCSYERVPLCLLLSRSRTSGRN